MNFSTNLSVKLAAKRKQKRQKQTEKIQTKQRFVDLFGVADVAIPLQNDVVDEHEAEENRKVAKLH